MSYIGENLDDQFNIIKLHKNGGGGLNNSLIFLIGIKKKKKLTMSLPGCLYLFIISSLNFNKIKIICCFKLHV